MNLCFVSKYPPIQGGVSTQTYWLARALARQGHNVFVVTNAASVESEYRLWLDEDDYAKLEPSYPNGGSVRVLNISASLGPHATFIPADKPTVTQLAAVATDCVRENDCVALFSWYFEPYGIAAGLAAAWTGRPHVVRHAGSDMFSLALDPELGTSYRELMRASGALATVALEPESLGNATAKAAGVPPVPIPADFSPEGPAMDLASTVSNLRASGCELAMAPGLEETDESVLLGMYGKLGRTKGTDAFLMAAAELLRRGADVRVAVMGGGRDTERVSGLIQKLGLDTVTWRLPPLAPWRVPEFIRRCDAVAYLEHDFRIKEHLAVPPLEILAAGGRLCASPEASMSKIMAIDADSAVLRAAAVVDPRDVGALADALLHTVGLPAPDTSVLRSWIAGEGEVAAWHEELVAKLQYDRHSTAQTGQAPHEFPASAEFFGLDDSVFSSMSNRLDWYRYLRTRWKRVPSRAFSRVEDHARAEFLLLWGRVDVESLEGVPTFSTQVDMIIEEGAPLGPASRPLMSQWTRVEEFGHDVSCCLSGGERRDLGVCSESAAPCRYLFAKTANLNRCIFKIGEAAQSTLALCDGTRTIEVIEHEVLRSTSGANVRWLLRSLGRRGLVGMVREEGRHGQWARCPVVRNGNRPAAAHLGS
jgi:glycosyltransferase involved in cell wall biosynthesis